MEIKYLLITYILHVQRGGRWWNNDGHILKWTSVFKLLIKDDHVWLIATTTTRWSTRRDHHCNWMCLHAAIHVHLQPLIMVMVIWWWWRLNGHKLYDTFAALVNKSKVSWRHFFKFKTYPHFILVRHAHDIVKGGQLWDAQHALSFLVKVHLTVFVTFAKPLWEKVHVIQYYFDKKHNLISKKHLNIN